jgi:trans-2-enoyl-CoA reductase
MGRKPVRVPNGLLIFKDLRFRGFWVSRWFRESTREQREEMFKPIIELVRDGDLAVKVAATYPLSAAKEAIEHAGREARGGKVLFTM